MNQQVIEIRDDGSYAVLRLGREKRFGSINDEHAVEDREQVNDDGCTDDKQCVSFTVEKARDKKIVYDIGRDDLKQQMTQVINDDFL